MQFSDDQIKRLSAPLQSCHVKKRTQAGRQVSYVEGWHAISEANRIFGFDAWNRETVDIHEVGEAREVEGKWRVAYMARVRITVGTIIRDGCGYGSGIDRDLGSAHESAIKEAETDAMKRALMTFGNPFGLALYDKDQTNVATGKPETNAASDKPKPTASYQLVNPDKPSMIVHFSKAGEFMAALREKMEGDDPARWWAVNGSAARHIANQYEGTKFEKQALADFQALEALAVAHAA